MQTARPFTDSWSVSLAGLAIIALAAGSFTSGLLRQLNVPLPDNSAQVVILPPRDAPPPASLVLAQAQPPPVASKRSEQPSRTQAGSPQREEVAEPSLQVETTPNADQAPRNVAAVEPVIDASAIQNAPSSQAPEQPLP